MSEENNIAATAAEENALELEEVGAEEAPNAPTIAHKEEKAMAAVDDVDIAQRRLSLFIVLIASIVLLFAIGHNYDWDIVVSFNMCDYAIRYYRLNDFTKFVLLVNAEYGRLLWLRHLRIRCWHCPLLRWPHFD
jgi:hypothetical protein